MSLTGLRGSGRGLCGRSVRKKWNTLSNFKSNALCGGTVLKNDGTVKGAVRWVRWYGTVGTVGTVRWVRRVRYGRYGGYGTMVRWVRYGGYGTVGAYLHPPYRTHRIPPCAVPTVPTVPYLAYPAYHTHRTHRTHRTKRPHQRTKTLYPPYRTHRKCHMYLPVLNHQKTCFSFLLKLDKEYFTFDDFWWCQSCSMFNHRNRMISHRLPYLKQGDWFKK